MAIEIHVFSSRFSPLLEQLKNIEIQTIFNSQCAFLLFGKTSNELRLQFNAKQSSITKLQFLSVTYIIIDLTILFVSRFYDFFTLIVPVSQEPKKLKFKTSVLTIVPAIRMIKKSLSNQI